MDYKKAKVAFESASAMKAVSDAVLKVGGTIGSNDVARELSEQVEEFDYPTSLFIINLLYSQKYGVVMKEYEYTSPDGEPEVGRGFSSLDAALNDGYEYQELKELQGQASETPLEVAYV